jgi:uncharacterized protein
MGGATSSGIMGEIAVSAVHVYPVKSCAGIPLNEARLSPTGLELDRSYMLVDEDDDFLSQRKVPELALVSVQLAEGALAVLAPGMPPIEIPLEVERDDERLIVASVHEKPVTGQIVSEELNEWFTAFLPAYKRHRRYRLLRVREDLPRYVGERYRLAAASNRVSFADGSAILLASERSLARLNEEMAKPVGMDRFRPNVVVDGLGLEPYDEDYWLELRIGSLRAFVTKPSDRCVTTDVDQETAVTGKAVRRALLTRKGVNAYDEDNAGVFFAQNLNHVYEPGASVRVGDAVEVVRRGAERNVRLNARRGRMASVAE